MLPGFQIKDKLYESEHSLIYRARRATDDHPAVLKVLNHQYPTPRQLARYQQEFSLLRLLDGPGVIRAYSLEKHKHTAVIVLEDFGGTSLHRLFRDRRPAMLEFLDIAIQLGEALGYVHRSGIIHKDINPSNVVWNPDSRQLKIIDFGIATQLSSQTPKLDNLRVLEGTLPYLSPEQTGRMNRHIDYRTDFYALGATFYELLTGRRPFESQDPLELVHCHLAAQPRPPSEVRSDIPPVLSQIIMKLLAKTAEHRYQSAWGLEADLRRCREQIDTGRTSVPFPLGSQDISDRFEIPHRLYGREHEVGALHAAFERVGQQPREIVLVTGYSGIGKSSLVRELYEPLAHRNGFLVSGKFDLVQRASPYRAISTSFAPLIKQVLSGTENELEQWRQRLLAALGRNGRLLTNLIPELALLLGEQPEVEETGPVEAQNRMLLAFRSFIGALCGPEYPLVMFLDDLQWADPASLQLLESLMRDDTLEHFLFIGAYRDNEVNAAHPLSILLEGLDDTTVSTLRIHLRPLDLDEVARLVADTLRRSPDEVRALAEHVLHKTGGNPFFINVFLRSLHDEGLLVFDAERPGWRWSMAEIEVGATRATDNVAELLSRKLRQLPPHLQAALQMAACVGNRFDLPTIAIISGRSIQETHASLIEAAREGYIHPVSEPELFEEAGEMHACVREYEFVHDRIQQAAYALNPEDRLAAIHLDIGRLLLARLAPAEREERLFDLVDHLNLGRSLLAHQPGQEDSLTGVELARLNLEAGTRALAAAAYGAALRYLEIGIELAGGAWDQHPELMLSLHQEAAQAAYCAGDFERSLTRIDQALDRVALPVARARLYQLAIVQYTNQARYEDALRAARAALPPLGHTLPPAGEMTAALDEDLARIQELLGDRPIASLIDAPEVTDEAHRAAIELLVALVAMAFQIDKEMFHFLSARIARLSLEHGNTVAGAFGYSSYGMMLVSRFQDYRRGYEFGALALRLADRLGSASVKCKAGAAMISQIYPWAKPIKGFDAIATETYQAGLQSGELQYAAFVLGGRILVDFFQGMPLARLQEEALSYLRFSQSNKNASAVNAVECVRLPAAHLSGLDEDAGALGLDAEQFLEKCRRESVLYAAGAYHALMCQGRYLHQDYRGALREAAAAEELYPYIGSSVAAALLSLYHALGAIALLPDSSAEEQASYRQCIAAQRERLAGWAESCPENFRHLELLIDAEMARVAGEDLAAVQRYAGAIASAEDNGFGQHAALANELAARFWLDRGHTRYATTHLRDAHYGYARWGAKRKVALLEDQHARILAQPWQERPRTFAMGTIGPSSAISTTGENASMIGSNETIDVASVLKASQALSSEIALDRLLARLIGIVIQNAGAQHGCLILKRRDELVIEAQGTLDGGDVKVLESLPLEPEGGARSPVSAAIVNYVRRSRETVVLHDAAREGPFVRDPYVAATEARSILCMPLLRQGRMIGLLYLENNVSPQAFTPERVELLHLLSSQMAISLENSLLYGNLHRTNEDLERLLYSISHDLKEPLRSIQSFAELLARRYRAQIDNRGRDYLARIVQSGQRLGSLFEAIRVIMKIRRSSEPRQRVSGESLVREAVERLRPAIDEFQAKLQVAPELPRLTVERRWAQEALYHLLQNALQYTGDSARPEIDIDAYEGSEGTGFVIRDRGPGIPEEHAERVFDLFRRFVGRERVGTGAGLTIVRQIALKHGGNAWLRPRAGGGTEVYLTFRR